MSQAKVDKYKKEKANRKKLMRQEKLERLAWKIGGSLVCVVLVGWIGFSVYGRVHVDVPESYEVTTTAISDYLSGVGETEAAE